SSTSTRAASSCATTSSCRCSEPDRPRAMNGRAPVQGRVRVTSFSTLAGWALAGLVLGRALRPVAQWLDRHPPVVAWSQPAVLGFVAVVLAVTAWSTKQALERPHGLEPQQA